METSGDVLSPRFWHDCMFKVFLQHWKRHCLDVQHGGYLADFDRRWQPSGPGNKSLVSHGRLIYNFSAGHRHSRQQEYADAQEYAEAADWGMRFLLDRMADPDDGGWLWRCRRDGTVLEPVKHTYGHAFVIFGLSELARATGSAQAAQAARQTLLALRDKGRGPVGGFWTLMNKDWTVRERPRGQNPHMHLLEACMSLYDVTQDGLALQTALDIAQLAAERFLHPRFGCLEEYFAEDWSRLPDDRAAPIQVGHQFEWCWLLHRLADRTGQDHWRDLGDRLAAWGLRYGTDAEHGGFYNACSRRGEPVDTNKSFWVESEALRALLYLVVVRQRGDLKETLSRSAQFILARCADPQYGGWYTEVDAAGNPIRPDKGSEWKLDYHPVALCDEALRVLG